MSVDVLESVKRLAEPVLSAEGVELVDIEYRREARGWTLRLFIDKDLGITLDDCSNISGQVGQLIDVNDLIQQPYILEVSSPGLNRPLKKEEDFIKQRGKRVRLKLHAKVVNQANFIGKLLDCREGMVEIETGNDIVKLPLKDIVRANLEYDF